MENHEETKLRIKGSSAQNINTKSVERYTAARAVVRISGDRSRHDRPLSYLGGPVGEMGQFHRAVMPAWLIIGRYNKVVNNKNARPIRSRQLSAVSNFKAALGRRVGRAMLPR